MGGYAAAPDAASGSATAYSSSRAISSGWLSIGNFDINYAPAVPIILLPFELRFDFALFFYRPLFLVCTDTHRAEPGRACPWAVRGWFTRLKRPGFRSVVLVLD